MSRVINNYSYIADAGNPKETLTFYYLKQKILLNDK